VENERADRIIADVGRRVAEARRQRGWTQQEAAEHLKMPLKNLQRIEAGMNLTIKTLVRLARGLGVPTRSLFDEPASREARSPGRPPGKTRARPAR
jgi:transcriptional regulator with XRE-family HTH domain